jgi:ASC-1-like (ASCH) protein
VDGPSHGVIHVRVPCPTCGWAEKRADRTKLAHLDEDGATFTAVCFDHGSYETHIDPEDDHPYLDLATLYRNLVKERALGHDPRTLHVMMKGGDWAFGCQLVDGALGALNTPPAHMPIRVFTPQVLAPTADPVVRAHEMGIYKRYFDLIAAGRKSTEIRVNDSSRRKIKEGSLIRFRCQGDHVLTRVTRVIRYDTFDEMFDHEEVASVNPLATRDEQLANIRQIYPPEREALGVIAFGIELVGPPRTM